MENRIKIRALRAAKGLSQADAAQLAGLRREHVSHIESGQVDEWERRLLEALGYEPGMDQALEQLAGQAA